MRGYPDSPGAYDVDTSIAAAESVADMAPTLRRKALEVIAAGGGATADEVAAQLGVSVLAMRPRITELKQQHLIRDTGIRRRNASGRSAAVLAVAEEDPPLPLDFAGCGNTLAGQTR
ncbi:hypothetical protein CMI47_03660 [Candidatus Pacearchaeota archaeon]|nr:hypothetical protein [Candidatus Pacearchaeota archaeon]